MNPQSFSDRPTILAETHEVFNQTPPLQDHNLFDSDVALREGVIREGSAWALADLRRHGEIRGRPEAIEPTPPAPIPGTTTISARPTNWRATSGSRIASRLHDRNERHHDTLPRGLALDSILERAHPD